MERVAEVVVAMSEVIPFFPKSHLAQRVIAAEVHKFVGSTEQLNWFAMSAMSKLAKYESIPQLRAFYATRYDPADGQAPTVDLPGFSAADLESRYAQRELEEQTRRFEEFRRLAIAGPVENRSLVPLPQVRRMS